jgi:hypothetical protein
MDEWEKNNKKINKLKKLFNKTVFLTYLLIVIPLKKYFLIKWYFFFF